MPKAFLEVPLSRMPSQGDFPRRAHSLADDLNAGNLKDSCV